MKKIFLTGIILTLLLPMYAQNNLDALRSTRNIYGGTARFQSMGGAFGALGGDFSSIGINPAGLGVYRSAEFVFTPALRVNNTSTTYLGDQNDDFEYNFNINNLGYVAHIDGRGGWEGVNIGLGFNRLNNFHQTLYLGTNNAQGSLLDEFIDFANEGNGSEFYEDLAWFTEGIFLHDPATNNTYVSSATEIPDIPLKYTNDFIFYSEVDGNPLTYGHSLNKTYNTSGKLSEFVISAAGNYGHTFYIGGSVGIQRIRYESTILHYESTQNSEFSGIYDPNDRFYFRSFDFKENNLAWGTGVNFKFGAIYRPIDLVRFGVSFHSPTAQFMESEFSTSMTNDFYEGNPLEERSELGINEYRIITPSKLTASLGFQIEKFALISFDYEYLDYSKMRFKSDDESFRDLNNEIQDMYTSTHNFRGGAEFRIGPFALRGGAAYYTNPYTTSEESNELNTIVYSGGAGIMTGNVRFDIAYVMHNEEYKTYPYSGSAVADVESMSNRFVATLGFRF